MISALSSQMPSAYYAPVENQVWLVGKWLQKLGHEVSIAALRGSQPPEGCTLVGVEQDEEKAFNAVKPMLKDFDVVLDWSNMKHSYVYKHDDNPGLKLMGMVYPQQGLAYHTAPPVPFPCLVASCEDMAQKLSAKLGCSFRIIPYAVENVHQPVSPENYILYLGRFEKDKGPQIAVDVARKMRMDLVLAGEDVNVSDQTFPVRLFQQADGRLIRIVGRVQEHFKHELIAKARCMLLPYLTDEAAWTCMPAIEALSHGVPVVALNKGGVGEIIVDGLIGFLAEKMEELPLLVKKSFELDRNTVARFAEAFKIENVIKKYDELIRACVNGDEW
jgi:glycosyltransferase involved in cell wall biosynthesis